MEPLQKMKVAELREALKERGLDTSGTKQVLLDRLQEAMEAAPAEAEEVAPAAEAAAQEAAPEPEQPADTAAPADAGETNGAGAPDAAVEEKAAGAEMTDEERRLARAKRFGLVTTEVVQEKKKARAERFGLEAATKATAAANKANSNANSKEMQEKLKARQARFGSSGGGAKAADAPVSAEFGAKMKARAERFK
mmetsp:Transcript_27215/g.68508  ORF Transcript_27215/g.68508 Transcript_27215/m.68508 type:complete len:195 (-) Transcript_27215:40-624(-)